jgi:hypothetical protein
MVFFATMPNYLEKHIQRLRFIEFHCEENIDKRQKKIIRLRREVLERLTLLVENALARRDAMTCLERSEESKAYYEDGDGKPPTIVLRSFADWCDLLAKINVIIGGMDLAPSMVLSMARKILFATVPGICGDRYLLTETLDRDTPVYEALDLFTKTTVAIKVLGRGLESREEINLTRLASQLSNVFVKYIAVEPTLSDGREPRLALVLERCGNSLFSLNNKMFGRSIPCPRELFCNIFLPVCRGLAVLHGAGIMHCDIKLDNILFNNGESRIIDMGLASHIGLKTRRGSLFTVGHVPPEIACTQRDKIMLHPSADIFALGITMLRMALPRAGEIFSSSTKACYDKGRVKIAKYLLLLSRESSQEMAQFIMPLLEYNPEKRPTASELCASNFLNGFPENETIRSCMPCFDVCASEVGIDQEIIDRYHVLGKAMGSEIDINLFLENDPESESSFYPYCGLVENNPGLPEPTCYIVQKSCF